MRLVPAFSIGLLTVVLASNEAGGGEVSSVAGASATSGRGRTETQVEQRIRDKLGLPAVDAVRPASFESLAVAPDGTAWAVSPPAIVRRRPDDTQWRVVRTGQTGWFRAVSSPDASTG